MKRVVITGYGIISCLGNDATTVMESLRYGISGIRHQPEYAKQGLRSQIAGNIDLDLPTLIPRKCLRFMGDAAAFAYLAMQQAIEKAQLTQEQYSHPRTGLIVGSGGGSPECQIAAVDVLRARGIRKVGPYRVPQTMCSTISASLSTFFNIKGLSYSISSACTSSLHCLGVAYEQIRYGMLDRVFAGGGEEEHWSMSMMFDAMGALSKRFNDKPTRASRPYDQDRDGFVIAGGAGIAVLESLDQARKRGAPILAEIIGYGATSDGQDMVLSNSEGAERCMLQALGDVAPNAIDYLNTHGTSTQGGDIAEIRAIEKVFGDSMPYFSSTKGLSGHPLGAAGIHEIIYTLLMMEHRFIAASANVEMLDTEIDGEKLVRSTQEETSLRTVMSNNFGFGGANGSVVLRSFAD